MFFTHCWASRTVETKTASPPYGARMPTAMSTRSCSVSRVAPFSSTILSNISSCLVSSSKSSSCSYYVKDVAIMLLFYISIINYST